MMIDELGWVRQSEQVLNLWSWPSLPENGWSLDCWPPKEAWN
jgi:hypothetical protein